MIVLGAGAMGSSACAELAGRGLKVLGLDRFAIPNTRGSSHGATRAFRMAYFEHPDYVPLLKRSLDLWRSLEEHTRTPLLTTTGAVLIGLPESELIRGTLESARRHSLDVDALDTDGLRARVPQFVVPDGFVGVEERIAGLLFPEATVSALARLAVTRGAELRAHERVVRWSAGAGGVTVETEHYRLHADHLVVCAGPWSGELLGDLGLGLAVTRQAQCWFSALDPEKFEPERFPIWGFQHKTDGLFYGFPRSGGRPGIKVARHVPGDPEDADSLDTRPRPEDSAPLRAFLESHLPRGAGELLGVEICCYTNSPDAHFVIDRHPEHDNVSFACGFSGHGFKFTPVVGEVLADLATKGSTPLPAGFLGISRFS